MNEDNDVQKYKRRTKTREIGVEHCLDKTAQRLLHVIPPQDASPTNSDDRMNGRKANNTSHKFRDGEQFTCHDAEDDLATTK